MSAGNAIVARMGLDLGGFRKDLGTAVKDADAAGKKLGSALRDAGTALGVGFGAASINEIIQWADSVADLSQRYTVSAKTLQQWGNVAEANGSSMEGVAAGLNKLTIAQDKALAGDEQLIAHFGNLGVSIEALRSMSPDDLMLKIGSGAMNASDLVAVLGKSALELAPALAAVASGAADLGAALEDDQIATLASISDAMKEAGQTIKVEIGGALVFVIERAKEAGVLIGALANIAKGITVSDAIGLASNPSVGGVVNLGASLAKRGSTKDALSIAGTQLIEMENEKDERAGKRKPRDAEETKSAEKAAAAEKKRIEDIRDGEEEQLRRFRMQQEEDRDKAAAAEKKRIEDIRDGEEEQLRQFRMQQEEDREKAAKAELARIEAEKQARLTAERAVKQERKNQFISDADDPNGRRDRNRQRLRDESLGRRFEREEGLRARGGQSSADFNRGDFKEGLKARTKADDDFIGPRENLTQQRLRERKLHSGRGGTGKNGSSPEVDTLVRALNESEVGKGWKWLRENYGVTV